MRKEERNREVKRNNNNKEKVRKVKNILETNERERDRDSKRG